MEPFKMQIPVTPQMQENLQRLREQREEQRCTYSLGKLTGIFFLEDPNYAAKEQIRNAQRAVGDKRKAAKQKRKRKLKRKQRARR